MKKLFFVVALVGALCAGSQAANAQYARRDVKPPVPETGEYDPSTPLGKVQEIAARLEAIEASTDEISAALEKNGLKDYDDSISKILEATGATRLDVAQLGRIASSVDFAVEAIEGNTAAVDTIGRNVATTAQYLRHIPTADDVDLKLAALEKTVAESLVAAEVAQTVEVKKSLDEWSASLAQTLAEYRESDEADVAAMKGAVALATKVNIALALGVFLLVFAHAAKWLADKK